MGMFLFLVGILGIVGSIVWLIIGLFKRSEKKKAATLLVASVVVMIVGSFNVDSSNNEDTASANTTESTEEQTASSTTKTEETSSSKEETSDTEKINSKIEDHMEETKGWALGELDSEGNPIDNGEPNESDAWALLIDKIDYDDGYPVVYVNEDFVQASEEEKSEIASNAQSIIDYIAGDVEDWDTEDYQDGLFLEFKRGNESIGSSEMLDKQSYKWTN
ncbi:hypothetical protein TEHAL1_17030 [Tetragenococcus halophilus]|uniref:hypothetical protein n=1 Tax=Tetragenococcus halophilus TaxID=51669 RepID=UPI002562E15E|nr:hypothetical protein [Tetragenococcus halophilus]GMG64228.1 hypothetical protein TEHAL1_17030 [Tetragenococcus halophilus]GMG68667.1 hypothetical protein TEHMS4_16030 [Tetragenococcus halophilus]